MPVFSRRGIIVGGVSAGMAVQGWSAQGKSHEPIRGWIASNAVQVRTIDAADDDFADLEPLRDAIGAARVVQLGEPSHGAGSAFAAKARIMRFLHYRAGFDLLIWESGLYDVAIAQAAMRSPDDGVSAARRGVFALWSAASEIRPLFEYIKTSQAGLHPLEMAGFDMQVTADGTREHFAQDLRAFADAPRDPALRNQAALLADQLLAARERLFASNFVAAADLEALTEATQTLLAIIEARRGAFEVIRNSFDGAFMAHAIENARADAAMRYESARSPTSPDRESHRDSLNATNLRWLLEERYVGRKAVVWAHNAHVMNAFYAADFHKVHVEQRQGDMKPMGVFLKQWLGREVYTVGMTAFEGQEGFATGGPINEILPAPNGSLEAGLHTQGWPYAFVDFRAAMHDRGSPIHSPQAVRVPKFETSTVSDISSVYDGMFFIDRMSPATHV